LDLYCASDNPIQIKAFIWFGTHDIDNSGPGAVGTAYGIGTNSIGVAVSFPLDEYERKHSPQLTVGDIGTDLTGVLRGDRLGGG
jgi:hypothetical protein